MRAVRVVEGGVRVLDVPRPREGGVRVRVRAAGICGSDLHMLAAGVPAAGTLGHELAGVLDDGSPVAIEPLAPCGGCDLCEEGEYHLCRDGSGTILGIGRDGGMADELCVPERCLVPLPAGLAVRDACLVEPLAVAVHGLRLAGLGPGERVAVVGGGSIGLLAVAAARAQGAEVALAARHDAQRAAGEQLGARPLGQPGREEFALVVDAAGTPASLEQGVLVCRPGGRLLLLATYWEGLTLPGFDLCRKQVRVVPSMLYGRAGAARDVETAAALLAARPRIARAVISHRLPLEAAPEAFRIAADRKAGALKVVLEP
jgi:threonine dehydrogenase-like Zn-dependent dehydrogenase